MRYDPEAHGAKCRECPRNTRPPVPPLGPKQAKWCWLGQDPGKNETRQAQPFVGATGKRLQRIWDSSTVTLEVPSIPRTQIWVTNAALCEPLTKSEKEARNAMNCCAPRLKRELEARLTKDASILAMGKWAFYALTGKTQGVSKYLGFWLKWSEYKPEMESKNVLKEKA